MKAFCVINKNKKILKSSSSGGAFHLISSYFIKELGASVYGAAFTSNNEVKHIRITDIIDLHKIMGSKYVKSKIDNCFKLCKEDLINDKIVLFSGTPCQINCLYSFLDAQNIDTSKLFSIDIICHGAPEPKYWKEYLKINKLENENINFRDKSLSWENYSFKAGKINQEHSKNEYMKAFLNDQILCDSCYVCKDKGNNRRADITLGDFWGINNINNTINTKNGVSLVLIRNREKFYLSIFNKCKIFRVPVYEALKYNESYYKIAKQNKSAVSFSSNLKGLSDNNFKQTKKNHISFYKKKTVLQNNKHYKSKKICIVTDNDYSNFGNRLQNYALIIKLRELGFKPINLWFVNYKEKCKIYLLLKLIFHKNTSTRIRSNLMNENIYNCSKKYENSTFFYSRSLADEKKLNKFKMIIFGSDQIWNLSYHKDVNNVFGGLNIENPNFQKISYAASMCLDNLSEEQIDGCRDYLSDFSSISVRETSSIKLLEKIGIKSELVCDPTLLLTREEWDAGIKKYSKSKVPDCRYALVYGLAHNLNIPQIKENLEIIDISKDKNLNQFDFINLIKNADLVITNSYHCLIFSIIYEKKAYLMERNSSSEMKNRFLDFKSLIFDFAYNKVMNLSLDINNMLFEQFKMKSFNFLVESLNKK